MGDLGVFGQVTGRTKVEPLTATLVGMKDGKRVEHKARFQPSPPAAAALYLIQKEAENGGDLQLPPMVEFLEACSTTAADGKALHDFLYDQEIQVQMQDVWNMYRAMLDAFSGRPTQESSASSSGGKPTKETSAAGSRARASASTRNRSSRS